MSEKSIFELKTVTLRLREFDEWLKLKLTDILTPDELFEFIRNPELNMGHCEICSNREPFFTPAFAMNLLNNRFFWEKFEQMEKWQQDILRRVFDHLAWWRSGEYVFLKKRR